MAEGLPVAQLSSCGEQLHACQPGCLLWMFPASPSPTADALHCPACRNVARQLASGELPQPPAPAKGMSPQQAAEALAVGSSHPTWLVQGWLEQYGPAATMALTKHNNL